MRLGFTLAFVTAVGVAAPTMRALAAQAPAAPATEMIGTRGPLADTLRAFAHDIAARLRALDLNGVVALYDTAHFVHVSNGEVSSWAEMARSMRNFFATATSNPVRVIGTPSVTLIDANVAVIDVTHTTDTPAGGRPAHEGIWTAVVRRGPGGWRIIHSHSSDRRRPPNEGR